MERSISKVTDLLILEILISVQIKDLLKINLEEEFIIYHGQSLE